MTAIYLLRHPQTTWNAEQRYQGRLEAPLSDLGRQQAARISSAFSPGDLNAIISSPLLRARFLAERLAQHAQAPLHFEPRFTEMALGAWEGLYREQIEGLYPELYDRWYTGPDMVCFPCGEDLHAVRVRVLSGMQAIFERWPDGNVAVVTHSVVIQVLGSSALGTPLRDLHRLRASNGGITTICGQATPGTVLTWNETGWMYGSPVAAAAAHRCASWQPRRMTQ